MKRIRNVLVGTDFSGTAGNAAARAARTAAEHGAALQILHVMSEPALAVLRDAYQAPAEIERSLRAQAETRLEELRARLASTYGVSAKILLRVGVTRAAILEESARVDLLVLGARGTNPIIDSLIGTTAARLLRAVRLPLLIVKQQAVASYTRVLTAVDLSPHASATLEAADCLARNSPITVVHAFDVPFAHQQWLADASNERIARWRELARERIGAELHQFVSAREGGAARWRELTRQGDAVPVVLGTAQEIDADLIVVCKHGRSLVEETLIGSVSRRILANARCDVLVVPPRSESA